MLLLFRQGGRVVNNVWTGSAGGHFEEVELNNAKACVLRELNEGLSLCENDIENLSLRYVTLRNTSREIKVQKKFNMCYNMSAKLKNTEKGSIRR